MLNNKRNANICLLGLSIQDENTMETLGHVLKNLRESRGLTQDELGAKIDKTRQRIECIENRLKKAPITDILLIIGALELTADERKKVMELANLPDGKLINNQELVDELVQARNILNSIIGKLYKGN